MNLISKATLVLLLLAAHLGVWAQQNNSGSKIQVTFLIEVEPIGHGPWIKYKEVTVASGEIFEYEFPPNFQSRWIRFTADKAAVVTAWLNYE